MVDIPNHDPPQPEVAFPAPITHRELARMGARQNQFAITSSCHPGTVVAIYCKQEQMIGLVCGECGAAVVAVSVLKKPKDAADLWRPGDPQ